MSLEVLLTAGLIFVLRLFNNALGTVRLIFITRQQPIWAAALAFIEALTFTVVIANVVKDLNNVVNVFAYCGGFAVGGYVGMIIEARFVTSYVTVTIIARERGRAIAVALRGRGFGVTETVGEGHTGAVSVLRSLIARRQVDDVLEIVRVVQPEAFVSIEESRAVQQVIMPEGRSMRR